VSPKHQREWQGRQPKGGGGHAKGDQERLFHPSDNNTVEEETLELPEDGTSGTLVDKASPKERLAALRGADKAGGSLKGSDLGKRWGNTGKAAEGWHQAAYHGAPKPKRSPQPSFTGGGMALYAMKRRP